MDILRERLGIVYGEDIPLERTALVDWCISRFEAWGTSAGMEAFREEERNGHVTLILGGKVIGLPPVLNFGSPELQAEVVPEVLAGRKFICLAISEAHAGSDVFGLQTTARKTEDGQFWIVNGSKKWITNGT